MVDIDPVVMNACSKFMPKVMMEQSIFVIFGSIEH